MLTGPASINPTSSKTETYAALCISNEQDPNSFAWWPGAWPHTGRRTPGPARHRAARASAQQRDQLGDRGLGHLLDRGGELGPEPDGPDASRALMNRSSKRAESFPRSR